MEDGKRRVIAIVQETVHGLMWPVILIIGAITVIASFRPRKRCHVCNGRGTIPVTNTGDVVERVPCYECNPVRYAEYEAHWEEKTK
jgi:hypothetical protein